MVEEGTTLVLRFVILKTIPDRLSIDKTVKA